MRRLIRKIRFLIIAASVSLMWVLPDKVLALEQPAFGGNNASDYQPPTGNPQNNAPSSLQPTNTALQPVTTLNQQALTQNGGLSVLTAPDKGATSTAAEPIAANKPGNTLPIWTAAGLLVLAAGAYLLFKPDKQLETVIEEPAPTEKLENVAKPKTAKKPIKKTSRKKRKAARN